MSHLPYFTRRRNGELTVLGELTRRAWWAGFLRGASVGLVAAGLLLWWIGI